MGIYHIFIVSKSGGLIFNYDHNIVNSEQEKTYSYPLDIQLKLENKRVTVVFGSRDGVLVGHTLLQVNGQPLVGKDLPDGRDVFEVLADKNNFPLNLKFGRSPITTNEKIVLASMFYPLYAIAVQLSPELVTFSFQFLSPLVLSGVIGDQRIGDRHLQASLQPNIDRRQVHCHLRPRAAGRGPAS